MKEKLQKDLERAFKNNNNVERIVKGVFQAGLIDAVFDFKHFNGVTLLMVFAMQSNYKMTERLLKEYKANRLIKKDNKFNALFLAIEMLLTRERYNPDILTLLLEQDAAEQITSQEPIGGHTVVSFCVMHNRPELVKLFLSHTTEPLFLPVKTGDYPLHLACALPSESTQAMLNVLLQHQPDKQVLQPGAKDELPIHTLLFKSDMRSLPMLLKHSAKDQLVARRNDGTNILHIAAIYLQFATFAQLRRFELVPSLVNAICGENSFTPLFLAIADDEDQKTTKQESMIVRFVSFLLEDDADVMAGINGLIPLEKCCEKNYVETAKLLLTKKTNEQLSNLNCDGFSPLMTACMYGAVDMVRLLLTHPICQTSEYLLQRNKVQRTALHLALLSINRRKAWQNSDEIITLLLQYHPQEQLTATDIYGLNVMHFCAYIRNTAIATLFVEKAPELLTMPSLDKMLPITLAVTLHAVEIVKIYFSCNNFAQQQALLLESEKPLEFTAIDFNCFESLTLLLQNTPDASTLIRNDLNLLQLACLKGRYHIVKFLLIEKKMRDHINSEDSYFGSTALHLAIMAGFHDIVELLCANDADVHQLDFCGYNALAIACTVNDVGMVKILLAAGADPTCKITCKETEETITARLIAEQYKNLEMMKLFAPENESASIKATHAFLKLNNFSDKKIDKLHAKSKPSLAVAVATKKPQPFTWCKNSFSNSSKEIIRAHLRNEKNPVYLYIPTEIKQASGFSDNYWLFLEQDIRTDPSRLKSIQSEFDFHEHIIFCDEFKWRKYQFVLKVSNTDCIILFMVPSDDCKACLLVAGRYVHGGLHAHEQALDLILRIRADGVINITLPGTVNYIDAPKATK